METEENITINNNEATIPINEDEQQLSIIDKITIEYMTNRNQKSAVERFFQNGNLEDSNIPKKDIRGVEYEIYQKRVNDLFSRMLEDFIISSNDQDQENQYPSSWSNYDSELKYKFHSFMSSAISHLEENGIEDDYNL